MARDIPYNFGALTMPPGYSVVWFSVHEHYQGIGPNEWESTITVDPHQARRWCLDHYNRNVSESIPPNRITYRRHGQRTREEM